MVRFALKNTKKSALALIGVAALGLTMAGPAMAQDATNVTITGGSLSLSPVPTAGDFPSITLDGTNKQESVALSDFAVIDARGTGAGWQLQIQASQFKEWAAGAYVVSGAVLPSGSLSMEEVTVSQGTGSSPVGDLAVASGPYAIDAGSAVALVTAGINEGMGTFNLSAADSAITLTLSVPARSFATTYRSDVTVDFAVTP